MHIQYLLTNNLINYKAWINVYIKILKKSTQNSGQPSISQEEKGTN